MPFPTTSTYKSYVSLGLIVDKERINSLVYTSCDAQIVNNIKFKAVLWLLSGMTSQASVSWFYTFSEWWKWMLVFGWGFKLTPLLSQTQ